MKDNSLSKNQKLKFSSTGFPACADRFPGTAWKAVPPFGKLVNNHQPLREGRGGGEIPVA
jgi:hypothetical protein